MHQWCIASAMALFAATSSAQVSEAAQPISMGIVLDTSGSMGVNMRLVRGLVAELAKSAGPADEFALIQSSDRPVILSGFAGASELPSRVEFMSARGPLLFWTLFTWVLKSCEPAAIPGKYCW
jgi:hypothetical protein